MGDQSPSGSKLSVFLKKIKPYLAMVSLQFGYAGMYIISMVSFKHGMSNYVLSVYRHVVAFCVIAPFALVLERFEYFLTDNLNIYIRLSYYQIFIVHISK